MFGFFFTKKFQNSSLLVITLIVFCSLFASFSTPNFPTIDPTPNKKSPRYKEKAPHPSPNFLKIASLASDISVLEDQPSPPDTPTDFPSPDDRLQKESEMELQELQDRGKSLLTLQTPKKILLQNLQNPVPLGSGASATVSKVTDVTDGRVYALKRVALQYEEKKDKIIPRELNTLFRCNHENVIKMYDAFLKDSTIYIVLEYCECGSLQEVCRIVKTIPEPMVSKIAKQVLLGLQYLHETMEIIHRDIKPANILCTKDGMIKLADFGMAGDKGGRQVFETFVGSEKYMSPERLKGGSHGFDSDLWSVALTLAEVNSGEFPLNDVQLFQFYNGNNTEATVSIEKEMHFAPDASNEFKDFCLSCLKFNPTERPTIRQLLQHPFIRKYDFKHSNEVSMSLRRWLYYNVLPVLRRQNKK